MSAVQHRTDTARDMDRRQREAYIVLLSEAQRVTNAFATLSVNDSPLHRRKCKDALVSLDSAVNKCKGS